MFKNASTVAKINKINTVAVEGFLNGMLNEIFIVII